jgi:hypothetical protein
MSEPTLRLVGDFAHAQQIADVLDPASRADVSGSSDGREDSPPPYGSSRPPNAFHHDVRTRVVEAQEYVQETWDGLMSPRPCSDDWFAGRLGTTTVLLGNLATMCGLLLDPPTGVKR